MIIRKETSADIPDVHQINRAAFPGPVEADLVDALRDADAVLVSLVAEENGKFVGHILFSQVTVDHNPENRFFAGLAPLAVLPEHQHKGIGGKLVTAGLDECRTLGIEAVVVLGSSAYYPKFGFRPSTQFGLGCEYDAPPEDFMVVELMKGALSVCSGTAHYHPIFHQFDV